GDRCRVVSLKFNWHQDCNRAASRKGDGLMLIETTMPLGRWVLLSVTIVVWTAVPAQAQWALTPYLGMNVAGGVEHGKGGVGGSVAYLGARIGFEFDVERSHPSFKAPEWFPLDLPRHPTAREERKVPAPTSTPTRSASWATWWCPFAFEPRASGVRTRPPGSA